MDTTIKGIHHITAMTSDAKKNFDFYTKVLGMRLIKKTVNQDDVSAYHLFYADDKGNPGTDLTFFEFRNSPKRVDGTNRIGRFSLRVKNDKALDYWLQRFDEFNVPHSEIIDFFGAKSITFEDIDGLEMRLLSDEKNEGMAAGVPYPQSVVPADYQIIGLGVIQLQVHQPELTIRFLTEVLGFYELDRDDKGILFEIGEKGHGAQVYLVEDKTPTMERQGFGGVHHIALRVDDRNAIDYWAQKLPTHGFRSSGFVERYYFQSLYVREQNYLLFELATDGPGFFQDEPYETAGTRLSLPPYFESRRKQIEQGLVPINTSI